MYQEDLSDDTVDQEDIPGGAVSQEDLSDDTVGQKD